MAGIDFTTRSVPISDKVLNGGLNSTAGALGLQNNESSDLQNIDFNKFGSILKRNGYTSLTTTAVSAADIDGLFMFETANSGATVASLVAVAATNVFKMDGLDGTWDALTSGISITAGNQVDFATFQNILFMTNGADNPFNWDATRNGQASVGEVVAAISLTAAKYVEEYNNYLFYANVVVSGTNHTSRIYWSNLKDTETWTATDFIDISQDDGQQITGMKVLGDRLVVFKTRSIYNVFYTGDADVPFILPGGGKSNSAVGCAGPFSVQEVDNGLVFLSHDGFYFYDGLNSFKISDRITTTLDGMAPGKYVNARSLVQKNKNRYWCALTASGGSENDTVFMWDYFNNAWSKYAGMAPSAMTTLYTSGEERPYWGDYDGFVYRSDTGTDDYPLNSITDIDAFYWTNWKHYEDLVDKKGVTHLIIYHQISTATLTFAYSYDFDSDAQASFAVDISTSADTYGSSNYGEATYASSGGAVKRRDLPKGRGRVVRFKFSNNNASETFQVDGFGSLPHLETIE